MVENQLLVLGAGKLLLRDGCAGPLRQLFAAFCQKGPSHLCRHFFLPLWWPRPGLPGCRALPFACAIPRITISPFRTLSLCPDSSGDRICEQLSSQLLAVSSFHAFHFKEVSCQVRCSEVSWCFLLSRPLSLIALTLHTSSPASSLLTGGTNIHRLTGKSENNKIQVIEVFFSYLYTYIYVQAHFST